jgi:hypothetical protein
MNTGSLGRIEIPIGVELGAVISNAKHRSGIGGKKIMIKIPDSYTEGRFVFEGITMIEKNCYIDSIQPEEIISEDCKVILEEVIYMGVVRVVVAGINLGKHCEEFCRGDQNKCSRYKKFQEHRPTLGILRQQEYSNY